MNTFAHTISPSAIAAMDGMRVERALLQPNGGRYESLGSARSPRFLATPPERRPGGAGGPFTALGRHRRP